MTKLELLTSISKLGHADPLADHKTEIIEILGDAMLSLQSQFRLSAYPRMVSIQPHTITDNQVVIPTTIIEFEGINSITSSVDTRIPYLFQEVDIDKWKRLGYYADETPSDNIVYYFVSSSNILFHPSVTVTGLTIEITYIINPKVSDIADGEELINRNFFTRSFIAAAKALTVQNVLNWMEGMQK